jgi:polysaccharide export outer membrane protein
MRRSRLLVLVLVGLAAAGCLRRGAPLVHAQPYPPPAYGQVGQTGGVAAPQPFVPPPHAPAPASYAYAAPPAPAYTLDSGDRLRISVFGQDGISNSYAVDAGGFVNVALIGAVPARGTTTAGLARAVAERLRQGYIREPHVTVEIEAYRPFFILGEVTTPGQYPYVANMTVETAVAIAGGYTPRARAGKAQLTRSINGRLWRGSVPASFPLKPGDTVTIRERWF